MPTSKVVIPVTLPSDSGDVADALDVARALLAKGQDDEAIRWVRRAIEAADESGDASRIATLARVAAELADAATPPSATPNTVPSAAPPPPRTVAVSEKPVAVSEKPISARSAPPPVPTPRSGSVAPVAPSLAPSIPSSAPPVLPKPVTITARNATSAPGKAQRLRVSVKISARDPSLFVVRRLPEGAALPPGTHLAFLEMDDVDVAQLPDLTDALSEVESGR